MKDIYGPNSTGSLNLFDPPLSLESRSLPQMSSDRLSKALAEKLMEMTDKYGSTLYSLTWKTHVTPAGRSIYRLRASVRRISGKGCIGVPKANWRTPSASDPEGGCMDILKAQAEGLSPKIKLRDQCQLTGWPTPRAGDGDKNSRTWEGCEKELKRRGMKPEDLAQAVSLIGWTTENGPARLTASGKMLTGSFVGMKSGGQLNPRFSLWLIGLPIEWACCGERVTPLLPRKQKRS